MDGHAITMLGTGLIGDFYTMTLHGQRRRDRVRVVYSRSEAPRGQLGYYVVSDGGVNPYRVRVKSPCFTAMSVFHHLAKGMFIADVIALIGSLDVVLGEIDR